MKVADDHQLSEEDIHVAISPDIVNGMFKIITMCTCTIVLHTFVYTVYLMQLIIFYDTARLN